MKLAACIISLCSLWVTLTTGRSAKWRKYVCLTLLPSHRASTIRRKRDVCRTRYRYSLSTPSLQRNLPKRWFNRLSSPSTAKQTLPINPSSRDWAVRLTTTSPGRTTQPEFSCTYFSSRCTVEPFAQLRLPSGARFPGRSNLKPCSEYAELGNGRPFCIEQRSSRRTTVRLEESSGFGTIESMSFCHETANSLITRDFVSTASSAAHRISAMRFCSSMGGSGNSCIFRVFQLIVGESEPTDISMARSMNMSDCRKNGKNSGRIILGFARTTMA